MTQYEARTKAKLLFGPHGSAWMVYPPSDGLSGQPAYAKVCVVGLRIPLDGLGNRFDPQGRGRGDSWELAFAALSAPSPAAPRGGGE